MAELIKDRVRLDREGDIAVVTLARPEKRNGLDLAMMEALVATAGRLGKDRTLRAVILKGEGSAFCAGLDFASVTRESPLKLLRSALKLGKKTNLFQQMCWCWRELPVPVFAVIHGQCFGGGLQMALACDFRFTTPDSQWSVMEAKWGLIPDMSGMLTLRELVSIDVARELTYTGRVISGEQAQALGLASHVMAEPEAAARQLIGEILTRSPDSVSAAKALFDTTWHNSEPDAIFAHESSMQFKLLRSKNHKRSLQANFAKQHPDFLPRQRDHY